jgi:uncharacterized protein (DUF1778 family)
MSDQHQVLIVGRRPRRPRAEANSFVRSLRLSPREDERVRQAARVNGQKFAEFARDALITAAEDCLESEPDT